MYTEYDIDLVYFEAQEHEWINGKHEVDKGEEVKLVEVRENEEKVEYILERSSGNRFKITHEDFVESSLVESWNGRE